MTFGCKFADFQQFFKLDLSKIYQTFVIENFHLVQPWPIQIGSRATFLKKRHFEGQNLDFFERSNRFCSETAFFRDCRRATLKSFKGCGLAMADLVQSNPSKNLNAGLIFQNLKFCETISFLGFCSQSKTDLFVGYKLN